VDSPLELARLLLAAGAGLLFFLGFLDSGRTSIDANIIATGIVSLFGGALLIGSALRPTTAESFEALLQQVRALEAPKMGVAIVPETTRQTRGFFQASWSQQLLEEATRTLVAKAVTFALTAHSR
jgi:hypothetical protein